MVAEKEVGTPFTAIGEVEITDRRTHGTQHIVVAGSGDGRIAAEHIEMCQIGSQCAAHLDGKKALGVLEVEGRRERLAAVGEQDTVEWSGAIVSDDIHFLSQSEARVIGAQLGIDMLATVTEAEEKLRHQRAVGVGSRLAVGAWRGELILPEGRKLKGKR